MEEEIHEIIIMALPCYVNGFWKFNSANESINYSEAVNYGRVVYISLCVSVCETTMTNILKRD